MKEMKLMLYLFPWLKRSSSRRSNKIIQMKLMVFRAVNGETVRFHWTIFGKMTFLFANETFAFPFVRKIYGGGLSLFEKSKFFRTPFPGWKWESGFLEVRLFLG